MIEKKNKGTDFFVTTRGADARSDPDIFIAKTIENANPEGSPDYKCSSYGLDICAIPEDEIEENQEYYFGIFCSFYPCTLSMAAYYQEEYFMEINH
jgi:hypothetical protein